MSEEFRGKLFDVALGIITIVSIIALVIMIGYIVLLCYMDATDAGATEVKTNIQGLVFDSDTDNDFSLGYYKGSYYVFYAVDEDGGLTIEKEYVGDVILYKTLAEGEQAYMVIMENKYGIQCDDTVKLYVPKDTILVNCDSCGVPAGS